MIQSAQLFGHYRHGKPSGERFPAGSCLDEFQRLAPEPVVVVFPSILANTKEPHLRSSNLNFFSPTIGVWFKESAFLIMLPHRNIWNNFTVIFI